MSGENVRLFMRRLILMCGMFLTLAAGAWSGVSAAALACCLPGAGASAASDEHDCCRAGIADADARHPESQATSPDSSRENSATPDQPRAAHARMNCGGDDADASQEHDNRALAVGRSGLSCAECCANNSDGTPATATIAASEQNRVKRDAGSDSAGARSLFAPAPARISPRAPGQHAPPAPPARRHILISLFLI